MKIRDFYPLAGSYRPGQRWHFAAVIEAPASGPATASLDAYRPGWRRVLAKRRLHFRRGINKIQLRTAPAGDQRFAYMVELALDHEGKATARALTAVDVLEDWRDDPRYGFLSEFGPGDDQVGNRVQRLARFHVNCLQLYDWMYRHYRLLPPTKEFADALGRRLSLTTVKRAVDAAHRFGMAALAYAAVYAAEREFSAPHERWGLFDGEAKQYDLADLFFLMDLGRGSGWSQHMLNEMRSAMKALPIDGFHLDQYGYPEVGYTRTGRQRDVGSDLARFVDRASSVVRTQRKEGSVIFNCVDAWPLFETRRSSQAATYIEVWKPYQTYADLASLVNRARELNPTRPVILAAYPSCLRNTPAASRAQVSGTLALLAAIVLASGAWPLLLGEGDRVLADAYYPNHVELPAEAEKQLREILDLGVAAREFLRDPQIRPVERSFTDGPAASVFINAPMSSAPRAGHIWVTARSGRGHRVISLLDLVGQAGDEWDQLREFPHLRPVTVRLAIHKEEIRACWVMSPGQLPTQVVPDASGDQGLSIDLSLDLWTLIVLEERQARNGVGN